MAEPLLRVRSLRLDFQDHEQSRSVLLDVEFDVLPNEVMGLVGESGSGKTMTALAIMRLLPPAARVVGGRIEFGGQDLLALRETEMRSVRGSEIAMVFQNPRGALNPLMRAGDQVGRALQIHQGVPRDEARRMAIELLQHVGISDAEARARAYPHQLSGGMAQRVLIAVMLACRPKLLIADEPTTGLDVTIQAQIFDLIKEVQAEVGASLLLITHDLGVVSEVCQRVAVMYAGQIMEQASVEDLFRQPSHPYTERLLASVLRVDAATELAASNAAAFPSIDYGLMGCRFANRCPYVLEPCWHQRPAAMALAADHIVFCHLRNQESP
jgi:oligopeptide/dipeptide ABC transporter ATP-binding protein